MTSPYLSVIIPAYNEEKRIGRTLAAIYAYLLAQAFTWEILVVLDGSRDNTLQVVQQFADGKSGIRWIARRENRGKGFTVRQGMLAALGQIRLFTDADNSTEITHFDPMRPLLAEGYQVVIGSRDAKDAAGARQAVPQPLRKRLFGDLGNLLIQLIAVPGIWDTQCGFKAFTAESAESIFSQCQVERWAFDIEALALARRRGYRIGIIPVNWVDAAGTHVKPGDYLDTLRATLQIRWRLLTGAYRERDSAENRLPPPQDKP